MPVPRRPGRAALADPDPVGVERPAAVAGCASTAPARWCPVDDCLITREDARGEPCRRTARHRHSAVVPSWSTSAGRPARSRRGGRLLAGARGRAPGAGRDRARPPPAAARRDRPWTCTPASGCSPGASPTRSGPSGRVLAVEADRERLPHARDEPGRARGGPGRVRPGRRGARRPGRRRTSRSTSWSSTRPARAPGPGRRAGGRALAAGGRVRRLRPGRAGPRRRDVPRARLPGRSSSGRSTCSR